MSKTNDQQFILSQEKQQYVAYCMWLIISITILHRAFMLIKYSADLHALVNNNPGWLTWQFLTVKAMTEHFWESLLYLQQTPPVPTIILAGIIRLFGWPEGTAFALIGLQAFISMGTAILLFSLLHKVTQRMYISCVIAICFLLSTDLLVMEYNSFGQTFYENLTMFLLIASVYLFWSFLNTRNLLYILYVGLLVSLLALSRASFSYFFLVPVLFLILKTRQREYRYALLILCLGLLPHLLWCAKNYVIYDALSLSTSSWQGLNFAVGLARRGNEKQFVQSILQEKDRYPPWFVTMLKEHGLYCGILQFLTIILHKRLKIRRF